MAGKTQRPARASALAREMEKLVRAAPPVRPLVAVADLSGLAWLSRIEFERDYVVVANGPYYVGRIVDAEAFTAPLLKAPADAKATRITSPGSSDGPVFLSPLQRRIIDKILAIDDALGFTRTSIDITWDQSRAPPFVPQRLANWHQDNGRSLGFATEQGRISKHFTRQYMAASINPTVYLREQEGRKHGAISGNVEADARARGLIVTPEPYEIWLMSPAVWHRGQIPGLDTRRTFLRLNCYSASAQPG